MRGSDRPKRTMRKRLLCGAATLLIWLVGGMAAVAADETPRAIIERAIKAHGGQERLEKLKADRVALKGTLFLLDKKGEFTATTTVNMPAQFRNVMDLTLDGKKIAIVQIFNGDKAIVTIDGAAQKVTASALTEMRETLQLERAVRLTPLLKDKSFTLTALGESKVNDKPAIGVKVSAKNHREIKMFFDRDSGLLIKTEHTLEESGKEVTQEEHYSDFKDSEGYTRPRKLVVFRAGKKLMEAELVDATYLDKVDETLFTKP
jgi:hypothetical protein